MLETISGDRIRYELECIFKESLPEKVLRRAEELGILARLQPLLRGDGWLTEKFQKVRQISSPDFPSIALYLSLWFYHLNSAEIEGLIYYLRLSKRIAQPISDTIKLNARLDSLTDPELKPSRVYQLLHSYSPIAITANWLASEYATPCHHLKLFRDKLRYVKPALSGNDLIKMGIPAGPEIKEILDRLREARLDSKISSKQDEIELVKQWQMGVSSPPA
jgi:tRNA nucleotidyltransferase (CCA-adding enzyme)